MHGQRLTVQEAGAPFRRGRFSFPFVLKELATKAGAMESTSRTPREWLDQGVAQTVHEHVCVIAPP